MSYLNYFSQRKNIYNVEGSFTLSDGNDNGIFLNFAVMNRLCGIQWGVFTLGMSTAMAKINGNSIVMEWVGYPFVMATAMTSYLIPLHFAIAIAADTPQCEHSRRNIILY